MESISALERLPSDLLQQLIEYAPVSVFHLRTVSSVMRARVDEYASQRSYVPIVKMLSLGADKQSHESSEVSSSVVIIISVPKHLSNLLELRFKCRRELRDLFPKIQRRSYFPKNCDWHMNYGLKLEDTKMEHFECMKEFLCRIIEKVIVLPSCTLPLLEAAANILEKNEIRKLEVYSKFLSDDALNCLKTFNPRAVSIDFHVIATNADPVKFLIDVSSVASAILIDQKFVKEIPENSRYFCGLHNIEWGPVFLEMFSRKLDKLYILNQSYKDYLSISDLIMLKHELPKFGKKIWLAVACNRNENVSWFKDNDHFILGNYSAITSV